MRDDLHKKQPSSFEPTSLGRSKDVFGVPPPVSERFLFLPPKRNAQAVPSSSEEEEPCVVARCCALRGVGGGGGVGGTFGFVRESVGFEC